MSPCRGRQFLIDLNKGLIDLAPEPGKPIPIGRILPFHCKWIVEEKPRYLYCGHARVKGSFCASHHALAYVQTEAAQ